MLMGMRGVPVLGLVLVAAACESGTVDLAVDVRTDLVGGSEVARVETFVDGASIADISPSGSLLGGARVALAEGIEPSTGRGVRVVLYDPSGAVLVERSALVDNSLTRAVTLVVTRACRGVTCGGEDTCVDGSCRALGCLEGNEPECGEPACAAAGDCAAPGVACARVDCVAGVCLEAPGECTLPSETCDLDRGCVGTGMDAGPEDAGPTDAGPTDAGTDGGHDAAACSDCTGGCGCLGGGDCCFTCSGICGGACGSGLCLFFFGGSNNANINCNGTSTCDVDMASSTGGDVNCSVNATCDVDCAGGDGCTLSCTDTASCVLRCADATSCDLTPCDDPGGVVDCGGGVSVCGRACP